MSIVPNQSCWPQVAIRVWKIWGAVKIWGEHPCPCHGSNGCLYLTILPPFSTLSCQPCLFRLTAPKRCVGYAQFCPGYKPSGSFTEQSPERINWLHWLHFAAHTCLGLCSGWPLSSLLFEIVNTLMPISVQRRFQRLPQQPQRPTLTNGAWLIQYIVFQKGYIKPLQPCLQPPNHMVASVKRALGLNSEVFILALNVTITIISDYNNNVCHLLLAWNVLISLLSK